MKIIAVEEHIGPNEFSSLEKRLRDMDEAGIDMQVLGAIFPYNERLEAKEASSMARSTNDGLAEIVTKYPNRFASFAVLALNDPDDAANELERAVTQLGLKGTMLFSNIGGDYLDNHKYWVVLERAASLGVPIYLHPGTPTPGMIQPYLKYPVLSAAACGYAAETSLHALRLIASGVFDEYPALKIILGHMGEGIPYWLWRIDNRWPKDKDLFKSESGNIELQKKPGQYFLENFYVTTSGMFWHPVLQYVNTVLGADRVMFAVDYSPESSVEAVQFIKSAPIDDSDREKICHLNAERILRLMADLIDKETDKS